MKRRLVTDALLAVLTEGTGRQVGDGSAPVSADGKTLPDLPYLVLYPLDGGTADVTFDAAISVVQLPYQVTAVGKTRAQAEYLADAARTVMVGREQGGWAWPVMVPEVDIIGRTLTAMGAATLEGALWNVAERYSVAAAS